MTDRIKVVEVLWCGYYGGAERHVFDLAMTLDRSRYEVAVCFLSDGGVYAEKLERAGILTQSFHLQNGWDVVGIGQFCRWLKAQNFDVVHDHASAPWTTTVAGLATQARVVWSIHGSMLHPRNLAEKLKYRALLKLSRRYVDVYVTVSGYMEGRLVSFARIPDERLRVIYNGVDLERFQPLGEERVVAIRRELSLPAAGKVIGTVGRLEAVKRIDFLIDVAAELLGEGLDLWLVIAGEGHLESELRKHAGSLGISSRVAFLGRREDIPSILTALDVFVFASRIESFSIAVAEAMAMGRPVVAIRAGGVPEVVGAGEATGFLCEAGTSSREFAGMVKKLLCNRSLAARVGEAGCQRIKEFFSKEAMTAKVNDLYTGLSGGK